MSFYDTCARAMAQPLDGMVAAKTGDDVLRALDRRSPTPDDFLALLSPAADAHLEAMAQRARELTIRHFGRQVLLFTPLYLSNFCTNKCLYCGFSARNHIHRSQLTLDEVRAEGKAIAATGLKHLLILTGDHRAKAGPDYLLACLEVLAPLFPSVSIEIYAMTEEEYAALGAAGLDGMTMFQETYDEALYAPLHPAGPKRDFRFRLDAPERACRAGLRTVNVGALLGLTDWRRDAFLTGLHARHLQRAYPAVEVSISLPRMRPHEGVFQPACTVTDRQLVQVLCAHRIFLPHAGITLSTREAAPLRDRIVGLGVTKISAGVSTAVGGHAKGAGAEDTSQFEISDPRSVPQMDAALRGLGLQPVYKDWQPFRPAVRPQATAPCGAAAPGAA
ncbi:MAG: 2-iminoacetate synthase ThiH [Desulfovibrionaceae bacterium]